MAATALGWSYLPGLMGYQLIVAFLIPYFVGTGALMDNKGRVAAAVVGSVIFCYGAGAAVGGWIIETYSFQALGWAAIIAGAIAAVLFGILLSPRQTTKFAVASNPP